jgi:hypothetical protein
MHSINDHILKSKSAFLSFVFAFTSYITFSQGTQTIRGVVLELETQASIPGAKVVILGDSSKEARALTDESGNFKLSNITIGKKSLKISAFGFPDKTVDVTVTSGKEVVLKIEMEESASQIAEVEVVAVQRGQVNNDMAMVSAKTFNVEEVNRYAGSRGDPARMASNFAGVQGADDSRNDIVVRGNSPLGVIYRIEGVDIPNPNHFAIAGSMGGPVSILNNKTMGNSDFFTSAFPAEYGNSNAAVFDLKLRPGNTEKHEFTGQFGFLGTEFMAEGPLNKKTHSSYLAVYRYSTLSIFKAMGISIGTSAVPRYQDYCFNFRFPTKKGGLWSIYSLGGMSGIDIKISDQKKPANEFYGDDDRDQYFQTRMAVAGVSYAKTIKEKTFFKWTVSGNHERSSAQHDYIIRHVNTADNTWVLDSIYPLMRYQYDINRISTAISANHKISRNHTIKAGLNADFIMYNLIDSSLDATHTSFITRWDFVGTGVQLQPYVQYKWKPSDNFAMTLGIHSNYFSVSKSISPVEPRFGMRYKLNEKHTLSFGTGLHSQTQPQYTYFYQLHDAAGNAIIHNRYMGLTKSVHVVAGHEWAVGKAFRIKTEAYYQHLYDVPVEIHSSSFSLINVGSGFSRLFPDSLKNTGTGDNKGIELTMEKFFNKKFFVLFTASLFDAKYKGSDGISRNTSFNGKYALNLLGGYEFKTGKKSSLSLGTKITTAGGRWYGYVDTAASNYNHDLIYLDKDYNTRQFAPYFRLDFKINYKINAKHVTHEFALDLINLLNTKNILGLSYAPNPLNANTDPIIKNYQLGFLPLFYYKIDF